MNQGQHFRSKTSILIVDDTLTNLSLLTQMLGNQGYKVRVATSGKLALQSVESTPPDLILLDIKMPDMDGYEVCQQLKANDRTERIPVIFISSLDTPFDKAHALTIGGADYITKPFEAIEVLARIENQLRWRRVQMQLETQNTQLQLLLTTTQAISSAADVEEALEIILAKVCQTLGWELGEAWMPNPQSNLLEYSRGWHINDILLDLFCSQSQTFRFAFGEGLAGRVWSSQQLEWIADIMQETERNFLRAGIATAAGIKGVLAIPIVLENRVLAVLVFFQKQEMAPDERSLQLINAVATQLSSMIQRKKIEAALQQQATLDGLTQIANRRRFDEYLNHEWLRLKREQQPLSLIMLDVDFFKQYNDTYGHLAGDDCLRQVAIAIENAARRPADLAARYGGEEFAVILPNTDNRGAIYLASLIQEAIRNLKIPHVHSSVSDRVTVSLGVASTIPRLELSPLNLINLADKALYTAKQQGRDRLMFRDSSELLL